MILLFLLTIIEAAELPAETSRWVIEVLGGILLLIVTGFLKMLSSDFKALKLQVYKNKEAINTNVLKDESDSKEFKNYKDQIKEKDKHFEKTLTKIDTSIIDLTKVTGDLNVSVAKLEEKIK